MKAVALLFNDIHISQSNIEQFKLNWQEALTIAQENQVSLIVIGGDTFKNTASQPLNVLMTVWEAYRQACLLGFDLVVAEGNHDKVDRDSLVGYNHIFKTLGATDEHIFIVDDYEAFEISDDTVLYIMSYFYESGSFTDKYNTMITTLNPKMKNILYCHQGIKGGLAKPMDDELPTGMFDCFDSVLVGHYHDRKKIAGTNIEYIGASRQHDFGEDEEKGYTLLYGDGSTKFVKNQVNTRFSTINVDYDDVASVKNQLGDKNTKYRVVISCSNEDVKTVDKQKLLDAGVSKVVFDTESKVVEDNSPAASNFDNKFDKTSISQEYKQYCEKNGYDSKLGLEYINNALQ